MDYISKEDAINEIEFGITHAKGSNKETGQTVELFKESNNELSKAAERVKALPAADVIERRKGKWLRGEAYPHHIFCSVCYATYVPNDEWEIWSGDISLAHKLPRNFCPNCGADMRELNK